MAYQMETKPSPNKPSPIVKLTITVVVTALVIGCSWWTLYLTIEKESGWGLAGLMILAYMLGNGIHIFLWGVKEMSEREIEEWYDSIDD
jgi:hypothetical protein